MCGRYSSARKGQELIDEFQIERDASEDRFEPDYNVAPTKPVPAVIVGTSPPGRPVDPVRFVRELHVARWGLVPSWAKDLSIGGRLINARVETVHEKPAFRRAFARRRCLLPADGYFEWYTGENGRKQPFYIRPRDGGMMAMAGLYEVWRDPAGESILTCTVITTAAIDELGHIHDRMPMLVEPARWEAWLDPALTGPDEARSLLLPAVAGRLEAYAVSTAVNNVRNNGPELVKPLPQEGISTRDPLSLF